MTQEIRTRLLLMADAQYGSFSKSLIPECKPLLGVRLPNSYKQTAQTMFILKKPCCAVC